MSIEENPNKSQSEEVREEIPDGIGFGKQEKSNSNTMREFAENLNNEAEENKSENNN